MKTVCKQTKRAPQTLTAVILLEMRRALSATLKMTAADSAMGLKLTARKKRCAVEFFHAKTTFAVVLLAITVMTMAIAVKRIISSVRKRAAKFLASQKPSAKQLRMKRSQI